MLELVTDGLETCRVVRGSLQGGRRLWWGDPPFEHLLGGDAPSPRSAGGCGMAKSVTFRGTGLAWGCRGGMHSFARGQFHKAAQTCPPGAPKTMSERGPGEGLDVQSGGF